MDVTRTTLAFLLVTIVGIKGKEFVTVCYITSWSLSRPNEAIRYSFKDVDTSLCSHLVYAFAVLDDVTLELLPSPGDDTYQGRAGNYARLNRLKKMRPELTTLLSVGGQDKAATATFLKLTRKTQWIRKFVRSSIKFLRDRDFDGLDIDWEYPDAPENAKRQFSSLLQIVYDEFVKEARDTNQKQLLLSIAVSPGEQKIHKAYEIATISRYVDYIFIMAYDFFGSWSRLTGFNSPLFNRSSDPRFDPIYNVDYAVKVWLKGGAPRDKLVVGLTGAGSSFTINPNSTHEVGSDVIAKGKPGDLFAEESRLIYPEICRNIDAGWKRVFDTEQKVPFAYKGDQWVGYEDPESTVIKADYIIRNQLAGIMFWELSFDDFSGKFCHEGKYPLLTAIRKKLSKVKLESRPTVDPDFRLLVKGDCFKLTSSVVPLLLSLFVVYL
ncbi:chitinase-3-like protein 1 [Gigantopelta aegis]|uniref:chitinase-3-like protein 1 n=1 Tax=Gigantopelta aegis TaxID=1735272 RepID=UPI001B88B6AE|nr:chitinase-3-like protein 1 [Gigantopelta aegis]XP_041374601.1 chitinase-3-like protein 1 [Gigantopelta aegis]XP_041374602.1 chitinase-3-like protein 1 [Gigantopelta aegis]